MSRISKRPVSEWRWRGDGPDEYVGSKMDGQTGGYIAWMHDNTFKAFAQVKGSLEIEFKRNFKSRRTAKAAVVKWLQRNLDKASER